MTLQAYQMLVPEQMLHLCLPIGREVNPKPNDRSRFVGKEFNDGQMDGLFAATPPLEALRFLVHEAATKRTGEEMGSKVIMVNDVARVFRSSGH